MAAMTSSENALLLFGTSPVSEDSYLLCLIWPLKKREENSQTNPSALFIISAFLHDRAVTDSEGSYFLLSV